MPGEVAAPLLLVLLAASALSASATSAASAAAHDPSPAHGLASPEAGMTSWPQLATWVNAAARGLHKIVPREMLEQPPSMEEELPGGGWEARFAYGLRVSKQLEEAGSAAVSRWAVDWKGSGAGVPVRMLQAEELLLAAEDAPPELHKGKTAERALRLYNHAKWLAERNYARAAEWRYREAHRLARQCRRSVLAAHAFSRLGYFLMHWRRPEEAREVLRESERLSRKSNPLAPYLFGVLERRAAGSDTDRLRAAEERILSSGEQPSEEIESERQELLHEINFWRSAESSPRQCLQASDVAHALICLGGHFAFAFR